MTGVNPDLYKALPSIFATPPLDPTTDFLGNYCVETLRGEYILRDKYTGSSDFVPKRTTAVNTLTQQHQGLAHGQYPITRDTVKGFVEREVPVVQSWGTIPNGPHSFIFDKKRCVNLWNPAAIVEGDLSGMYDPAIFPHLWMMLRIIREALCGKAGIKSIEQMIDISNGDDPEELEFRFTMQWLAAIFQNPGVNLQTNLWFLGETKGIGKGTLYRVLKMIYSNLIRGGNQSEIEGGWTDWMEGYLLIIVDEFENSRKHNWGKFIKRETTNSVISLRKRNYGTRDVINIANWVFFSNAENPVLLEQDDRRNMQIQTTSDPIWKKNALEFNQWADDHPNEAHCLAAGLAGIFGLVNVNRDFIAIAPATQIRQDNQDHAMTAFDQWIRQDDTYPRDTWKGGRVWFKDHFERWRMSYAPSSETTSQQSFGHKMAALARKGWVKRRPANGNASDYCIPSRRFPAANGAETEATSNIVQIQEAIRRQQQHRPGEQGPLE